MSRPTQNHPLYTIQPKEIAEKLGVVTNKSAAEFWSPELPGEWRIGFSGICEVTGSSSRCMHKFCPTPNFEQLVSFSLRGSDQALLDRWISAIRTYKPKSDTSKETHLARGSGALLILSLIISFPALIIPATDREDSHSMFYILATTVYAIDAALLFGAGMLQRSAARTGTDWLGANNPITYGQGIIFIWVSAGLELASIPLVTWSIHMIMVLIPPVLLCLKGILDCFCKPSPPQPGSEA
ncbi:MAG: hypothetical protein M1840_002926 [Geoglossum simile]|nr:MAG: hypothetical protein M1840_002926 [Geoglossum simile]